MSAVEFSMDPLIPKMDQKLIKASKGRPALLRGVLKTVAEAVMEYITAGWPVDTANSLAGWGVRPGGKSWAVFNPVEYTSHVHDGLAEQLYKTALGRSVGPANALLKSRVARSDSKPGTRQRRTVTPKSMGRISRASSRAAVKVTDRAVLRKVLAKVQTLKLSPSVASKVKVLVRAGKVESSIRLLVNEGYRAEARRLSKLLQPKGADFSGGLDPTRI
jgi:hypothetical protein